MGSLGRVMWRDGEMVGRLGGGVECVEWVKNCDVRIKIKKYFIKSIDKTFIL